MTFQEEATTSSLEHFLIEHNHALLLITETGNRTKRWIDKTALAILYLLKKETFAYGDASFEWLFFIDSLPIQLFTSGSSSPGSIPHSLDKVSIPIALKGDRDQLLALINSALNAYFASYQSEFWGASAIVDIKIDLRSSNTKWLVA